jgi:hypothetical protein
MFYRVGFHHLGIRLTVMKMKNPSHLEDRETNMAVSRPTYKELFAVCWFNFRNDQTTKNGRYRLNWLDVRTPSDSTDVS